MEVAMLALIGWIVFALIPLAIGLLTDVSIQTVTILYFVEVGLAIVGWGAWDRFHKKNTEEV
jgi:hypothetical protein